MFKKQGGVNAAALTSSNGVGVSRKSASLKGLNSLSSSNDKVSFFGQPTMGISMFSHPSGATPSAGAGITARYGSGNGLDVSGYLARAPWERLATTTAVKSQSRASRPMPGTGVYKPDVYRQAYALWQQGRDPVRYFSISNDKRAFLDQISKGEGTDDVSAKAHGLNSGYDVTLGYNAYGKPSKLLSQLTLDEVDAYQTQMLKNSQNDLDSSAVGRYQIVRKTLRGLRRQLGLNGSEAFDADMQDRLAVALLIGRGMNKYSSGRITAETFQNQLASEWASIAFANTGKAKQHTGTSSADIQAVIRGLGQ